MFTLSEYMHGLAGSFFGDDVLFDIFALKVGAGRYKSRLACLAVDCSVVSTVLAMPRASKVLEDFTNAQNR